MNQTKRQREQSADLARGEQQLLSALQSENRALRNENRRLKADNGVQLTLLARTVFFLECEEIFYENQVNDPTRLLRDIKKHTQEKP